MHFAIQKSIFLSCFVTFCCVTHHLLTNNTWHVSTTKICLVCFFKCCQIDDILPKLHYSFAVFLTIMPWTTSGSASMYSVCNNRATTHMWAWVPGSHTVYVTSWLTAYGALMLGGTSQSQNSHLIYMYTGTLTYGFNSFVNEFITHFDCKVNQVMYMSKAHLFAGQTRGDVSENCS